MIKLYNASIITHTGECLSHKDIFIKVGRISRICDSGTCQPDQPLSDTIDCSAFFVSPGLVNLHAHTAMNIFKGIAEDVPPEIWFNQMIWPYESKMTDEDIYTGTLLGIAEMINNGVTAAADHYFGEEQVLRAAKDTGFRMDIAPTIFGMSHDFRDRLAQVCEFIRNHQEDSSRIRLRFGPHSDYTCPENTLAEITDEAKKLNLPLHIHLAETKLQVEQSRQRTGKTPFRCLYDAGGFALPVLVAHGLWITEEDLGCINENTRFAFCPKTYMRLASGRGGFFDLADKLQFSFGSDGAASSGTVNPLEQARLFAMLEKFNQNDAAVYPFIEIWQRLMSGHAVFGAGTGKIEENAPADLVIWDLHTPDTMAYYHPVSAILYGAGSSNVRYTMVEGEFLKYDGVLKMNFPETAREAERLQKNLLSRGKGTAKVYY
ncbi:MAG: amidohydrolase family protein [Anaerolineaceae bacterium]|nr:amidohydrolase family protein [Anaerolineaceae bacterium]